MNCHPWTPRIKPIQQQKGDFDEVIFVYCVCVLESERRRQTSSWGGGRGGGQRRYYLLHHCPYRLEELEEGKQYISLVTISGGWVVWWLVLHLACIPWLSRNRLPTKRIHFLIFFINMYIYNTYENCTAAVVF